jgi:hypothetical protein
MGEAASALDGRQNKDQLTIRQTTAKTLAVFITIVSTFIGPHTMLLLIVGVLPKGLQVINPAQDLL